MRQQPRMRLSTVVLDAPDASELADFYRRLLGWESTVDEGDWVLLTARRRNEPVVPDGAALRASGLAGHRGRATDDAAPRHRGGRPGRAAAHAAAGAPSSPSSNRKTTCGFILTLRAIRSACGLSRSAAQSISIQPGGI